MLALAGVVRAAVFERPSPQAGAEISEYERAFSAAEEIGRNWPGLNFFEEQPLIVADEQWAALFFAPPSHGFMPIRGGSCPCWRPRGLAVIRESDLTYWVFEKTGKEWEAEDVDQADAYRFQSGTLVAAVIPTGPPCHWVMALYDRFYRYEREIGMRNTELEVDWDSLSDQPRDQRARNWLICEQRLLAQALRAKRRSALIADWLAVRRKLVGERMIPDGSTVLEGTGGAAEKFVLEVMARLRHWRREDLEAHLADLLEAGGRDLWPARFYSNRAYYVGAALWMLVEDADPGLVSVKSAALAAHARIWELAGLTLAWRARTPGWERNIQHDPWTDVYGSGWYSETPHLVAVGERQAEGQLEEQAVAKIEVRADGYRRHGLPVRWTAADGQDGWFVGLETLHADGSVALCTGALHERSQGLTALLFGKSSRALLEGLHRGSGAVTLPQIDIPIDATRLEVERSGVLRVDLPARSDRESPW